MLHQHQDLIESSKTGKRLAQYQLYNLYVDAMYSTCFRMLGSREDAEDVLQESFITAFRKLDQFSYESTFGAWLKRVVVNHCLNFLRDKKVHFTDLDNASIADEIEEVNVSFVENIEDLAKVKQAVATLPDCYKQIITLYLFEGYDHVEIGEILQVSTGTSKSQYHRAKKKLMEILKQL